LVNFNVNADFTQVDKMLKRYGSKAEAEYSKAISQTALYGDAELKKTSPVVSSDLRKSWVLEVKNRLATNLVNNQPYASIVNAVKRKTPTGAWAKRIANSKSKSVKRKGISGSRFTEKILRSKTDGYQFIDKAVKKMDSFLMKQITLANERLIR